MSIQVNDFQYIQGKNDSEYIKLLKDALERQKQITNKAVHRIKELSNREKQVDCISRQAAIDALKEKVFHNLTDEFYAAMQVMDELPSAEPEFIRCKECRWKEGSECVRFADVRPFPDDFCSRAERRGEEE